MSTDHLEDYLLAQRFYFLAEQTLNLIQKRVSRVIREYDLTHTQYLLLLVMRYAELAGRPVNASELSYLLALEKHSVSNVIDRLAERELVTRTRSATDRRVVGLELTEEGRRVSSEAQQHTVHIVAEQPIDSREHLRASCAYLESLRDTIAGDAPQAEVYERVFGELLLAGQDALRKEHATDATTPPDTTMRDHSR